MNYRSSSSSPNYILAVFNRVKKNLLTNNFLRSSAKGNNFCKNINTDLNSPYRCTAIVETENFTWSTKLISTSMSNSMTNTCVATEQPIAFNESNIIFNVPLSFKKPMAQNLLARLLSGLSKFYNKEQNQVMYSTNKNSACNPQSSSEEVFLTEKNDSINTDNPDMHPINLGCPYWSRRHRNNSEHSNDICFVGDDDDSNINLEFSSCDEEEDTEDDVNVKTGIDVTDEKFNETLDFGCGVLQNDISKVSKCNDKYKTVRFNLTPEIHTMYAWSYAYKSARKGQWESLARDRDRFQKRIENTSKYLNPVLSPEHRNFIYNTRFSDDKYLV